MATEDWVELLRQLHALAVSVPNVASPKEEISGLRYLSLKHTDEHWEELNQPMHNIFGWGKDKGYLTPQSSRADFIAVHNFLLDFAQSEKDIGSGSCLPMMLPRMQKALALWYESVYCISSRNSCYITVLKRVERTSPWLPNLVQTAPHWRQLDRRTAHLL